MCNGGWVISPFQAVREYQMDSVIYEEDDLCRV